MWAHNKGDEAWMSQAAYKDGYDLTTTHEPFRNYVFCLAFYVSAVTSVGYGEITPVHELEVLLVIIGLAYGFFAYANLIGSAVPLLKLNSQTRIAHEQSMDVLQRCITSKA
jgi:hypothetical protein